MIIDRYLRRDRIVLVIYYCPIALLWYISGWLAFLFHLTYFSLINSILKTNEIEYNYFNFFK